MKRQERDLSRGETELNLATAKATSACRRTEDRHEQLHRACVRLRFGLITCDVMKET